MSGATQEAEWMTTRDIMEIADILTDDVSKAKKEWKDAEENIKNISLSSPDFWNIKNLKEQYETKARAYMNFLNYEW